MEVNLTENKPVIPKAIPINASFIISILLKCSVVNPNNLNLFLREGFFKYFVINIIGKKINTNSTRELKIKKKGDSRNAKTKLISRKNTNNKPKNTAKKFITIKAKRGRKIEALVDQSLL
jgi:hypothetical protein